MVEQQPFVQPARFCDNPKTNSCLIISCFFIYKSLPPPSKVVCRLWINPPETTQTHVVNALTNQNTPRETVNKENTPVCVIFQFEHWGSFTQTQPPNQNQTKREKKGCPQEINHSTDRRLSHKRVLNSVNGLRYIWIFIPPRSNRPHCVQNGGVISATKVSTNLF